MSFRKQSRASSENSTSDRDSTASETDRAEEKIWNEFTSKGKDDTDEDEDVMVDQEHKTWLQNCLDKLDDRVSFNQQVVMFLTLPVCFLLAFTMMPLIISGMQVGYLVHHQGLILHLGRCQHVVLLEEVETMTYLSQQGNESALQLERLIDAQVSTDQVCGTFEQQLDYATDDYFLVNVNKRFRSWIHNVTRTRVYIKDRTIEPDQVFDFFYHFILFLTDHRLYLAADSSLKEVARNFIELNLLWISVNFRFHVCSLGGGLLLDAQHQQFTTKQYESLFYRLHASYNEYLDSLIRFEEYAQGSIGEAFFNSYFRSNAGLTAAETMFQYLEQSEPVEYPTWRQVFQEADTGLNDHNEAAVSQIIDVYYSEITFAVVFAALSVILCLIASWHIAAANGRIRRNIISTILLQRKMERAVRRFVPKKFLRLVGCTKITQVMAGEPTDIALTMLFSDIRKFTQISQDMTNSVLFIWLQGYFSRMTVVVEKHHGFIDQFIGDAIFALFPEADSALLCACEMHSKAQQLNSEIVVEGGCHLVRIGVGLHHAAVSVGFIGDSQRLSSSIVSPEVSVASKLESITKIYGAEILCSEEMFSRVTQHFETQISHRVLGAAADDEDEMTLFEVFQSNELSLKDHKTSTARVFHEAVNFQKNGEFNRAMTAFTAIAKAAKTVGLRDVAAEFKWQQCKELNSVDKLVTDTIADARPNQSPTTKPLQRNLKAAITKVIVHNKIATLDGLVSSNSGSFKGLTLERRTFSLESCPNPPSELLPGSLDGAGDLRSPILSLPEDREDPFLLEKGDDVEGEDIANQGKESPNPSSGIMAIPAQMMALPALTGTTRKKKEKKIVRKSSTLNTTAGFSTAHPPPPQADDDESFDDDSVQLPRSRYSPATSPELRTNSLQKFNKNDISSRSGRRSPGEYPERKKSIFVDDIFENDEGKEHKSLVSHFWTWVDKHVPFSLQVGGGVFLLATMVITIASINFAAAIAQLSYIDEHFTVFEAIGKAQMILLEERGSTIAYLSNPSNITLLELIAIHQKMDVTSEELQSLLMFVSDVHIRDQWGKKLRRTLHNMTETRFRVKTLAISPLDSLHIYNHNGQIFGELRHYFGSLNTIRRAAKNIFELSTAWNVADAVTKVREAGVIFIYEKLRTGNVIFSTVKELYAANTQYRDAQMAFLTVASPRGQQLHQVTARTATGEHAAELMERFSSDISAFQVNITEWVTSLSALVGNRGEFDSFMSQHIQAETRETMTLSIFELIFGIVLCCISTVAIIHAQIRIQKKVDRKIEAGKQFNAKAQAFVPKQFLELCGAQSLVAVKASTHTEEDICILFSHIRGFTALSTTMSRSDLFMWLQSFFASMSGIVEGQHGFVDKFAGDAFLAAFTYPMDAAMAAIMMHAKTQNMNTDLIVHNKTQMVHIGVGIHFANVSVGFLGDENRLTSTMISKEVNMASRLEGMTKFYGIDTIFSQSMYDALRANGDDNDLRIRHLGQIIAKGAVAPYRIFELFQADSLVLKQYKENTKERFERAVWLRESGDLEESNAIFRQMKEAAAAAGVVDQVLNIKLAHSGRGEAFMRK